MQKKPQSKVHEQYYLVEVSAPVEMFYIYALQYGSHELPMPVQLGN